MTEKKFVRWFWAWEDEKEEAWLGEMAQQGWHMERVGFPGIYTFSLGAPRKDVYRLDYPSVHDAREKHNYLQLFTDAGWEYLGEMNSWQYFRKTAGDGEAPEIYSDNESKARKYRRILLVLVIVFPLVINSLVVSSRARADLPEVLWAAYAFFLGLYIFVVLNLLRRVEQLKKKM